MKKESKNFLFSLLETPSVSGREEGIQQIVRDYIQDYADEIDVDFHGNLTAGVNTKSKRRVMMAGHCDQIGFMVKHISKEGYIYVDPVGGIDFGVVPGSKAQISTAKGIIPAVFGRKAIHLTPRNERETMKLGAKYNWLDIGAKDGKEAKRLVQIGDRVAFQLQVTELANNLISGPGMDDRVGCYVAIETIKRLAGKKLNVAAYGVSTVQEEVGLRGATTAAYNINPEVGMAIDVTHSSDNPSVSDKKTEEINLSGGPTISRGLNTNPMVEKHLRATAKAQKIPAQIDLCPSPYGNDTSAIQVARGGTATASIGIPCRYMHSTVEVVSLEDIENAVKLLVAFISRIKPSTSFLPY